MKKTVVLITNSCPYHGEVFLRNELDYIPTDQPVLLFPILPRSITPLRDWDKPHIRVVPTAPTSGDKLLALGHALAAPLRHGELKEIFRHGNPARNFLKALKFAWTADSRARAIARWLKASGETDPVFYSYWFYEAAYAAARVRRQLGKGAFLSRCHGYDLYEVRHPGGYLPFRPYLASQVDLLSAISQDGMDYAAARFGCKLGLSRLGTADHGLCQGQKSDIPTIVSCSNLVDVKRIDLLIRGLSLCEKPLRWFHFGDGPLKEDLLRQAQTLPGHIEWKFMGSIPNGQLMAFYRSHYVDAFINVSSSEGVPVSIMEAMSFGIPIVATNVGGIHEIVTPGHNGLLLPPDPDPAAIPAAIEALKEEFRPNSRALWEEKCDAARLYRQFYGQLTTI